MTEHARPQDHELKNHGDELANAVKDSGQHSKDSKKTEPTTSAKQKE